MSLPMPKGHIPTAGLELDELIAEKVLGWKPSTWPGLWIDDMCKENSLSNFSTDIKAAWDLAEKFKLCVVPWIKEWRIYRDDKFLSTPREGRGWTAYKEGEFLGDGPKNAAPTAPHAICLAALFYASEDIAND